MSSSIKTTSRLNRYNSDTASEASDDNNSFEGRSTSFRRPSRRRRSTNSNHRRSKSPSGSKTNQTLEPPRVIYHASARSIVFRDSFRRASLSEELALQQAQDTKATTLNNNNISQRDDPFHEHHSQDDSSSSTSTTTTNTTTNSGTSTTHYQPHLLMIQPLPPLELGRDGAFAPLLRPPATNEHYSTAERHVLARFHNQTAAIKTIKNSEWHDFLRRFTNSKTQNRRTISEHLDCIDTGCFNSFCTSTSILPSDGRGMRCYGSPTQYTIGVVFALPILPDEDERVQRTKTWAWPAGYAAKTEFNVDARGRLINGREQALVSLTTLRKLNTEHLEKQESESEHILPYNEVFLRCGGGKGWNSNRSDTISFEKGVGLPIALFVRTTTYGHLIYLMRARARLQHVLGKENVKGIPLLFITPTQGVRVFTESLQNELWKIASRNLNPFQNPHISHKTIGAMVEDKFVQQKMSELIDFDDSIRQTLTAEELARLAGGFGATDESVEQLLQNVMSEDPDGKSHRLQDVVNEGLIYAVRSNDFYQARQLMILYTVVSSRKPGSVSRSASSISDVSTSLRDSNLLRSDRHKKTELKDLVSSSELSYCTAPPPPPLDTDRLRSATNSDGLLAVLGAAQILRVMKDGSAKERVDEVIAALEEWVEHGQHSVAFRISSWQKQRAAQGNLKIATETNSNFNAFAGKKAITNRKTFAERLRRAVEATDFSDARFLFAIQEIIATMHSPCLRLELLQYVLGLDNRFSVAHVARSVELAATCLKLSARGN